MISEALTATCNYEAKIRKIKAHILRAVESDDVAWKALFSSWT